MDEHASWGGKLARAMLAENATPRAFPQGLEMCYSKEALELLRPGSIWASPPVWNHSEYLALAALADSMKRAGAEDSIYLEPREMDEAAQA